MSNDTQTTFTIGQRPERYDAARSCQFSFDSEVKFMAGDGDNVLHPITMLARTKEPIFHHYWGRIVHDIEGIEFATDRIVADYMHDECEIIGYFDESSVGDDGLQASGNIVRQPGTMSERVAVNGINGVPYQASIFFDPNFGLTLEEVPDGGSTQVNGYEFVGPGIVVRSCKLKAIAICPHGYDGGTVTTFSSGDTAAITFKETAVPTENATDETKETTDNNVDLVKQVEAMFAKRLDEMEAKLSGKPAPIEDLPTALKRIEELEAKLSADPKEETETPSKETETATPDADAKFAEALEQKASEIEKRLEAKYKHKFSSDGNPASGDGGESASGGKKTFADAFRFADDRSKSTGEAA